MLKHKIRFLISWLCFSSVFPLSCRCAWVILLSWRLLCLCLQHKVLLQQFNTGDERAQKRQPIRGSDEGETSLLTRGSVDYSKSIKSLPWEPLDPPNSFSWTVSLHSEWFAWRCPLAFQLSILELRAWSGGACPHLPDSASPSLPPFPEGRKDYLSGSGCQGGPSLGRPGRQVAGDSQCHAEGQGWGHLQSRTPGQRRRSGPEHSVVSSHERGAHADSCHLVI